MADQTIVRQLLTSGAVPRDHAKRARVMQEAFTDNGQLRADALTSVLPWQVRDVTLTGTPAGGVVPGVAWRFPQGARITRLDAIATTAPSTAPFSAWLRVNGSDVENVSIPAGVTEAASGAGVTVPAGGLVQWRIGTAGAAADITLSVFYTVGGS